MSGELALIQDGLDGAVPWLSQVLRQAGLKVDVIGRDDLATHRPVDAVLLRMNGDDPVQTCWTLHRQGHRTIIAISPAASSAECIRLLNAGADYYLDAWLPAAELVARVRVALRFSRWVEGLNQPSIARISSPLAGARSDRGAATR